MSDFIVSLNRQYKNSDLLRLLKKPYGERAPDGKCFSFPWGRLAVLQEHMASNRNIVQQGKAVFAWVGDLVMDVSDETVGNFISRFREQRKAVQNETASLMSDKLFTALNGAFAILFADSEGLSIVTDLLGFVQVYVSTDANDEVVSIGTHPDLVSAVSDSPWDIDMISVGEFLNSGTPTAPNTIYKNVKELEPGRLYQISINGNKTEVKDFVYWLPPKEMNGDYDEDELAKELEKVLIEAVRRRCKVQRAAVLLSGGLDSRVLIAAVPSSVDCVAFTLCNYPNRETRIAKKVAGCYGRLWFPLVREPELLGKTVIERIKLIGCELDWVGTLVIGLVDQIRDYNVSAILNGTQFDVYLKGYFAADWRREKRFGGALPNTYVKNNDYGYINNVSAFWKDNLVPEIIEAMRLRRRSFFEENADCGRGSIAEWMIVYPFSNDSSVSFWPAERRILPIRLVATDRGLLDFAFRCPFELKLGKKIFLKAALNIYGPGLHIPNASDGVRPGSSHWSRLAQRAVRKLQDKTADMLEKFGKKQKIQHSWYDYQKYWEESRVLNELATEYGGNLNDLDGQMFKGHGCDLLKRKDIHWNNGFRLLHLAVWKSLQSDYAVKY
jgi:hypothetical protein